MDIKKFSLKNITPEQMFMLTIFFVNAGNYLYNLLLGRILGPSQFADAAILITFLLVLSFIGMTFQVVTAKYAVLFEKHKLDLFLKFTLKYALIFGLTFAIIIAFFSGFLQTVFNTKTPLMFVVFSVGLPLYFIMSINRGLYQGKNDLKNLSKTYSLEMLSRLIFTIVAVLVFNISQPSIIIALGITLSFIFGLLPFQKNIIQKITPINTETLETQSIIKFFGLTAFYELTQIIINNSDIMMVKHFFNNQQAGLYASLALIGRVVYFVAWMFVMLLLPKVILLKKQGNNTLPILLKYVLYVVILSTTIVLGAFLFPNLVVKIMFGSNYLPIAFLLWKYALATSIFAIANLFAYYFLSIGKYFPVFISAILGLTQIILIYLFHNSLEQVVVVQIIAMLILLFFQLSYFIFNNEVA